MSEPELRYVQALIENDQVEDALLYLENLEHPLADEWREQLKVAHARLSSTNEQYVASEQRVLEDGEIPSSIWERYMGESRSAAQTTYTESIERKHGVAAVSHILLALPPAVLIIGIISSVVLAILLIASSGGILFLLLLAGFIGFYVYQVEEITELDPPSGVVQRNYQIFDWEHYRITAQLTNRVQFGEDLPPTLHHPPSVSALLSPPIHFPNNVEQGHALVILQATISALWAWGMIDIYEITVQHSIIGRDVFFSRSQILVPSQNVNSFDVDGELERQVMLILERWVNTHHDQYAAKPWKPGPTFQELVKALRSSSTPFHAQILDTVRNDALGRGLAVKKGWRKKFEMTSEGQKELSPEAHNVQVLVQRVGHFHPEVTNKLLKAIKSSFENMDNDD